VALPVGVGNLIQDAGDGFLHCAARVWLGRRHDLRSLGLCKGAELYPDVQAVVLVLLKVGVVLVHH